jgi:hypothetical protein
MALRQDEDMREQNLFAVTARTPAIAGVMESGCDSGGAPDNSTEIIP